MPVYPYEGRYPKIGRGCYVAPDAVIIGDVTLEDGASVWYGAVLRGDVSPIVIGARTNIQDGTIIHGEDGCPTIIGADVTVGHAAIIHAATVGDRVLVGMGAVLLSRSSVGPDSIIGARALVTQDSELPGSSLILGMPAQVKRELTPEERESVIQSAKRYVRHAKTYTNVEPDH
jgi:carbonic anhydrase/acetyltransferase-like protein (isoleucine patch superfamily)